MTPDSDVNLNRMIEKVQDTAEKGANIICLPELCHTQYFPQYIGRSVKSLAESVSGKFIDAFSDIATRFKVVILLPVFVGSDRNEFSNAVIVIDSDGTCYPPYHKVHIPQDPLFFEKGYFAPGSEYRVYSTQFGKIAPLICYDQWFPEAARSVALSGADIIIYPTAIGDVISSTPVEGEWQDSWETIQRSHAIANSVHVAAVNRVGIEDNIRFFGGSFICDAFGSVLARAGCNEEIIVCQIDLSMNDTIRDSWGFMRNRRPDTYSAVCAPIRGTIKDLAYIIPGDTPRNRGYHMPAEWEPHNAVWLSWPHNTLTFPSLEAVEESYIRFIVEIHRTEPVRLLIPGPVSAARISAFLINAGVSMDQITLFPTSYSDVWIRDYGPTFVVNRGERHVAMVRWIFNAWGDKYDELLADGSVPGFMNQHLKVPVFEPGIILEGGSIDVNGRGTVLTTTACLLNPNRNSSLSREDIENYLFEYLGVVKVIWLHEGITGDDTDGHIDDIARFVGPSTVLCAYEDDPEDENYLPLRENYEILCHETDQDGNPLVVKRLPMPNPVNGEESRYPASYTNFYIGNEVVIVPVFDDPHDEEALSIIRKVFSDRRVVGIDARAMVEGYGTFHCATQQEPRI
jgi:agmatine deiminase